MTSAVGVRDMRVAGSRIPTACGYGRRRRNELPQMRQSSIANWRILGRQYWQENIRKGARACEFSQPIDSPSIRPRPAGLARQMRYNLPDSTKRGRSETPSDPDPGNHRTLGRGANAGRAGEPAEPDQRRHQEQPGNCRGPKEI